jgi:cytochrome c-type biogenesis protein CcmH/NrfG
LDRARSFLLRAANAKMLGADGYFLLGKIYTIQDNGEQAVRSLLWADKLQPDDPQIINEMAKAYDRRKKAGDEEKALAAYKRVYKIMGRSREGAKAYEVLVERLGASWEEEEKKRK